MATLVRVKGSVDWKVVQGSGGNWVAACEPLKLTLQAKTFSDLLEEMVITLNAVLKDLLRSDELPQFLRDRGWVLVGAMPSRRQDVHFDIPFNVGEMAASHGSKRPVHQ